MARTWLECEEGLSWPAAWPRERCERRALFDQQGKLTLHRALRELDDELDRLGADQEGRVVSTDLRVRASDSMPAASQRTPDDRGVAVYFLLEGESQVMACDRWNKIEHNLRAITKTIEALRGQERWGVGTVKQAFAGYKALPERASAGTNGAGLAVRDCWTVLDLDRASASPQTVVKRYRRLMLDRHPDQGGSEAQVKELQVARDQALQQLGG